MHPHHFNHLLADKLITAVVVVLTPILGARVQQVTCSYHWWS